MTAYRDIVIEHFRNPRNRGPLENANASADGANPLCGDRVRLQLSIENGVVRQANFTADACALCVASASVLTEQVRGLSISDAASLSVQRIHDALGGEPPVARQRCAALPVDTLRRAVAAFEGGSGSAR